MQVAEDLKKILVVEDEGLIAADIQKRLERLGYAVPAIARSGEEALECARATPFDLVLMDIRLKGDMDGIAAAQALKVQFETPVVYITAHADPETVNRAKLTEPFGYILKPISDGDLRSAVQISLYKHEMERRVRASEAWLSTTLRSVGEGIIATDPSGEIVFINPVAEQLTGWTADDAHGRLLMDVLGLCDETSGKPAKNPIYDLFPAEIQAYNLVSKNGASSMVEIGCVENRSADDLLGAIIVMRDIRSRRDMERRLVQSQRMEAITNLAGGLAHDFNNQLTVILGYADGLAARLSGGDKDEVLEIKHAASIASSITSQLLTLSRRDVARMEVLNVHEVICEMQPMISRTLGKTRTFSTDLGSTVGFVRGDRNQLKQVLLNLALNARDAIPVRGEFRIESTTLEIDPGTQQSRVYRPGPYARLRISDNGRGMDKETLSRIFEPFFTTKEAGFGTGLGLSIVHSIVTRGGGYITATSEPGKGTSFEILLPCVGTFHAPQDIAGAHARAVSGERARTVLLAEDEDGVRRLMRNYLAQEGFQLLEARNAEEAELLAEVYREPIDLLVTDVIMPGRTGPQLAEKVTRSRPDAKVLLVSGYRHDTLAHDGIVKREMEVLPKPFAATEFLRRVRALLGAEKPVLQ